MNLIAKLERQRKSFLLLVGFTLIVLIGCIDLLIGYEIGLSVFYVLPISLITWLTSRRLGVAASIASALVWLSADVATRDPYLHPLILVWNTLIRLTFFVIIAFLLSALNEMRKNNWPVTFSIGVLTCGVAPHSIDELVNMADELMYSVKHEGKNGVKYALLL